MVAKLKTSQNDMKQGTQMVCSCIIYKNNNYESLKHIFKTKKKMLKLFVAPCDCTCTFIYLLLNV